MNFDFDRGLRSAADIDLLPLHPWSPDSPCIDRTPCEIHSLFFHSPLSRHSRVFRAIRVGESAGPFACYWDPAVPTLLRNLSRLATSRLICYGPPSLRWHDNDLRQAEFLRLDLVVVQIPLLCIRRFLQGFHEQPFHCR